MKTNIEFINGKRVGIKEDPMKEGIIEIRQGVKGLDLGENKYAMAYIRVVDEMHYFKGMCIYSDKLPDNYDVICYYRDPAQGLTILKTVKPELELELSNEIMTRINNDGVLDWW